MLPGDGENGVCKDALLNDSLHGHALAGMPADVRAARERQIRGRNTCKGAGPWAGRPAYGAGCAGACIPGSDLRLRRSPGVWIHWTWSLGAPRTEATRIAANAIDGRIAGDTHVNLVVFIGVQEQEL